MRSGLAGWALLASMVAMSSLALPWVTKRSFPSFYRSHILFALLTGVLGLMHGFGSAVWNHYAPASVPGALFWLGDLAIRAIFVNCAIPCCDYAAMCFDEPDVLAAASNTCCFIHVHDACAH